MRPLLVTLALCVCTAPLLADDVPRLWRTPARPVVPAVANAVWPRNPIDRYVLARLEAKALAPTAAADRPRLLRRVTFDLTGLPPTAAELDAFVADGSPTAYDKVVTRLLASPRFGERWAQHWLDLVRYAESDGFKEDAVRPEAYRYRDWVIAALNAKLPYDRFVQLQLAGDELAPGDPAALVATGFNRLYPDEYNAANLEQRRQEILDDTTDTAGLALLGLTVGCARCHDHKFDPISQKDYFRLQAFFAAMQPRDVPLLDPAGLARYRAEVAEWEKATADVRQEIDKLLAKKREQERYLALTKFNEDIQAAVTMPAEKRSPLQWQIALMAQKQIDRGMEGAPGKLSADEKKQLQALQAKLPPAPKKPPLVMAMTDIGRAAPPTHRLRGGDWRKPVVEVKPGYPTALGGGTAELSVSPDQPSTGRRAALAKWLTRPDHPLTARVIVNRLWQHHFGVGLVATASDFGAQGTAPTHPELLDWLAVELVESGWDLAHLHRLMVTSAAYQQDSEVDAHNPNHARALVVDKENDLLWHARRRRLEGEAIRDAMLSVTGELTPRLFGPSARPELPSAIAKYGWKPDADVREQNRRSVYVLAKRNLRYPFFDAFDYPDMHNSCSRRLSTTTAPQALLLLNSELTLRPARRWAESLKTRHGDDLDALAQEVYQKAFGRRATDDEVDGVESFVSRQAALHGRDGAPNAALRAVADFCHAVLNANEFVFVD